MPTPQYYVSHFGGIRRALAERKVHPRVDQFPTGSFKVWNKENIPPALRKLYNEIGRPIKKDDLRGGDVPGTTPVVKTFGTLSAACAYSGIPVNQLRPTKSHAALAVYRELGLPTEYKKLCEFIVENHDNPNSVARLFSLEGAQRSLDSISKRNRPKIKPKVRPSKNEAYAAIRLKSQELGRTPTRKDMDADPNVPSSYMIAVVCGGYSKAVAEAGLTPNMSYSEHAKAKKRK